MTQTVKIADIDVSGRLKPVEPDLVAAYAAIAEERLAEGKTALIQPIVLRPDGVGGGDIGMVPGGIAAFKLTDGANRLAALMSIGVETLVFARDYIVNEEDDEAARQTEIFANLSQGGMTALDRAIFLEEAKTIADAKRGETRGRKANVAKVQGDKKMAESAIISSDRFTKEAAKRIGLAEVVVKDAVRIARALKSTPDVIDDLRKTPLADNAQELKLVAELDPDSRRRVVRAIAGGGSKTVRQAKVEVGLEKPKDDDPQAAIYAGLLENWNKADRRTRAQFMADVGLAFVKKGEAQ